MKNRILILATLALFLLAGCNGLINNPEDRRYFTGNEGVEMDFTRNNPPREIYFREDGETEFNVDVQLSNEGASLTRGAVYISGYDPTLIDFEEVDEERDFFQDCRYAVDSIGAGSFSGNMQCRNIPFTDVDGNLGVSIGDSGVIIDLSSLNLDDILGTDFFDDLGFDSTDVRFTIGDGGARVDINFNRDNFDPDAASRGPYFLSLWEGINFSANGGRSFEMRGDTPTYPGGEEEFITFHGAIEDIPEGRAEITQPLLVTSCYLYSTFASPSVCIDKDPYSENEKACRPRPYSSRGQGGPVAITSVTQRSTGNEVVFRIVLENTGRGTVYNPLHIQRCSPYYPNPVTEQELNVVMLGMIQIGDTGLECEPDRTAVRLYNGRGVVNCVYDVRDEFVSQSAFETPLIAEIWYGYSQTMRRDVSIKKI